MFDNDHQALPYQNSSAGIYQQEGITFENSGEETPNNFQESQKLSFNKSQPIKERDSLCRNRYQEVVSQSSDLDFHIRELNGCDKQVNESKDIGDPDLSSQRIQQYEKQQHHHYQQFSNQKMLEHNYRSNPLTSMQRKRMQDIFNEELDCEYDSQHRPKENLPQPHPHQCQPNPIIQEQPSSELKQSNSFMNLKNIDLLQSQHSLYNASLFGGEKAQKQTLHKSVDRMNNKRKQNQHLIQMLESEAPNSRVVLEIKNQQSQRLQGSQIKSQSSVKFEPRQSHLPQDQKFESDRTNEVTDYGIKESNIAVWGRNQHGQLCIDPVEKLAIKIPLTLSIGLNIKHLSCGKSHALLLTSDNQIYSIGSNLKGQLGIGSLAVKQTSSPLQVQIIGNSQAVSVYCGRNSSFAIIQDTEDESQKLLSWGSEKDGMLGIGETLGPQLTPKEVMSQSEIITFSAGRSHAALITKIYDDEAQYTRNDLYIWGSNKYGQLGLQDFDNRDAPCLVKFDSDPLFVSCGDSFTLLVVDDNQIFSAGSNLQGQLGQDQSVNRQNQFIELKQSNLSNRAQNTDIIDIQTSDFASAHLSDGSLYVWGPTPIGQFNSPQLIQGLIQDDLKVNKLSLGNQFGLIQDSEGCMYQMGTLFQESRNSIYFNKLENLSLENFCCGYDFVIATSQSVGEDANPIVKSRLTRSQTQVVIKNQRAVSINSDEGDARFKSFYNKQNLQVSDGLTSQSSQLLQKSGYKINQITGMNQTLQIRDSHHSPMASQILGDQNIKSTKRQNLMSQNTILITNEKLQKHLDSCTPVRKDQTPRDKSAQQKSHVKGESQISQNFTPNQVKLRLQNSSYQKLISHETSQANFPSQFYDHDLTNLVNTPQNIRKNLGLQADTQILSTQNDTKLPQFNHRQLESLATPSPFRKQQIFEVGGAHQSYMTSSYAFNPMAARHDMMMQSIDNQEQIFRSTLHSQKPSLLDHLNKFTPLDIIAQEKQELQSQVQIEVQRRLFLERDLQNALKQIQSLTCTYQGNLHDLTTMLESAKRDNDNLMVQVEEQNQEIEAQKEKQEILEEELNTIRQMYEEQSTQVPTLNKEIEQLKAKLDITTQFTQLSLSAAQTQSAQPHDRQKDLDDLLAKKSKEIYELIVQLGCLKEENVQLKRDLQESAEDFKERLESQQIRASAEIQVISEENQDLRRQIEEMENAKEDIKLKILELEGLNKQKYSDLQSEVNKLEQEIQLKNDTIEELRNDIQSLINFGDMRNIDQQQYEMKFKDNQISPHINEKPCPENQFKSKLKSPSFLQKDSSASKKRETQSFIQQTNRNQLQENNVSSLHDHKRTHILNPIETPQDSQRNSLQPVISAIKNNQNQKFEKMSGKQISDRFEQFKSQLTPKQLKQTFFGKDRQTSNREQGCLQVINSSRRKSAIGANTQSSTQNMKTMRGSKSGTGFKQSHATNQVKSNIHSYTQPHNCIQIRDDQSDHSIPKYVNPTQSHSPIHFTRKNSYTPGQAKLQQQMGEANPHMLNQLVEANFQNQMVDLDSFIDSSTQAVAQKFSNIDYCTAQTQSLNQTVLLESQNRLNNSKSPLRGSTNNTQSQGKFNALSKMYQKHQTHHQSIKENTISKNQTQIVSSSAQNRTKNLKTLNDSSITPRQEISNKHMFNNHISTQQENKFNPVRQSTSSKASSQNQTQISSSKQVTPHTNSNYYQPKSPSILSTPKASQKIVLNPNDRSSNKPANDILKELNSNASSMGQQSRQSLKEQTMSLEGGKTQNKNSLNDMKHKLQDIQSNKQYLEKKIMEYEKKLNELKGVSGNNQCLQENQKTQEYAANSKGGHQSHQTLNQKYSSNQSKGFNANEEAHSNRLTSLSAAVLEKVLNNEKQLQNFKSRY